MPNNLYLEAVAEIASLRAAYQRICRGHDQLHNERDEARDENERLRAAIAEIEQEDGVRIKTYARIAELLTEIERLRAENDMMRSLLIEAPTKEERDELFERRFCKGPHTECGNQK